MASLIEHAMINKLGDDLDSAITFAGGDTSSVTNIMQYPEIIKQQLSASGVNLNSSIILEGDSCVIKSDEDGRDYFNTEYASGIKTGLNPQTYYVRICTAVKDIEPVYIDMTPITDLIGTGEIPGDLDMDAIVEAVLKEISTDHFASSEDLEKVSKSVDALDKRVDALEGIDHSTYATKEEAGELSARIEALEEIDYEQYATKEEITVINTTVENISQTYVSQETLIQSNENLKQDIAKEYVTVETMNTTVTEMVNQSVEENQTIVNITQEIESKVDEQDVQVIVEEHVMEKLAEMGNNQGLTEEEINDLDW